MEPHNLCDINNNTIYKSLSYKLIYRNFPANKLKIEEKCVCRDAVLICQFIGIRDIVQEQLYYKQQQSQHHFNASVIHSCGMCVCNNNKSNVIFLRVFCLWNGRK